MPDPDPATLRALLEPAGRALVDALTPYDPQRALSALAAARRDPAWAGRPEVVAAAATQARLRTSAARRFPDRERWWTAEGLEQATRPDVARRRAQRLRSAGIGRVVDLGCGAGSDALAMAEAGLEVLAVDRDPDALWALGATAADWGLTVRTVLADVTEAGLLDGWLGRDDEGCVEASLACFVDPARRTGGTRLRDPERWSPPWSWVCGLAGSVPAVGAKVAPGIAHALIPAGAQAEWVSVAGDLVEATAWWGPLREGPARRRAVVLSSGVPATLDDAEGIPEPDVGPVGAWLIEPDPAVIRAGLVSVLAAPRGRLLDPRIAYITTDTPPEESPLGAVFEVLEEVPFARKAMRAWLRARGYANVVVKKRGVNVIPEQLRADLRLGGAGPTATLVLTRTDAGPVALLVRRA